MQCRENENILDITATGNQVFSLTEGRLPQQMLEGKITKLPTQIC